jgi:hypothetical protein
MTYHESVVTPTGNSYCMVRPKKSEFLLVPCTHDATVHNLRTDGCCHRLRLERLSGRVIP